MIAIFVIVLLVAYDCGQKSEPLGNKLISSEKENHNKSYIALTVTCLYTFVVGASASANVNACYIFMVSAKDKTKLCHRKIYPLY